MAAQLNVQPVFEDAFIRQHDKRLWLGFVAVSALAVVLGVSNLIQTLRPRAVPYVIMLDARGEPVAVAHPIQSTAALNDVVIKWALMEFIRNAKTVINNVDEQKEMINTAFAFAREQASQ